MSSSVCFDSVACAPLVIASSLSSCAVLRAKRGRSPRAALRSRSRAWRHSGLDLLAVDAAEDLAEVEAPPPHADDDGEKARPRRSPATATAAASAPPSAARSMLKNAGARGATRRDAPRLRVYGRTGSRGQAGGLGQPEHEVHVLDRLAGGALDEVVLDDEDDRHVAALRTVHGDAADVDGAHRARVGHRSRAASRRRTARPRSAARTAPAGRRASR